MMLNDATLAQDPNGVWVLILVGGGGRWVQLVRLGAD